MPDNSTILLVLSQVCVDELTTSITLKYFNSFLELFFHHFSEILKILQGILISFSMDKFM